MIPKPFLIKPKEKDKAKAKPKEEVYTVVATGTDAESHDFFLIVNSDGEMKWINEDVIHEEYLFVGFLDADEKARTQGPDR